MSGAWTEGMLTLGAWFHDLDPVVFALGPFVVRWYGLSYVVGMVIAFLLWRWIAGRGWTAVPKERVLDAMIAVAFGMVVGGRVVYCVLYRPELIVEFTGSFPFWGVLAIHKGGMASHGGMAGLVVGAWVVSRGWTEVDELGNRQVVGRCSLLHVMDMLALITMPGVLLGRLSNFVNGELLGKIVAGPGEKGPWWTVQFPQELDGWAAPGVMRKVTHAPMLSEQQQAVLWRLVEPLRTEAERAKGVWENGVSRLIAEAGKHKAELSTIVSSRHPSQLYQAVAEGVVVMAVCWGVFLMKPRPGVVAAWFFISYGVLRVVTEIWRLPDAQFGDAGRIAGLSRGQWLSVGMVVLGAGLLVWLRGRGKVAAGVGTAT